MKEFNLINERDITIIDAWSLASYLEFKNYLIYPGLEPTKIGW